MTNSRNIFWEWVLPILFAAWMLLAGGVLHAFEFDTDEGVNLIKAALLAEGHPLYASIWSDQPPVLTCVLKVVVDVTGTGIVAPRLLMLSLSVIFLWGIGRGLRERFGVIHGVAAQALVLTQPEFLAHSGAVMIGLPAIYLAFLACSTSCRGIEHRDQRWIVLSAIALGLSVMTKLFTVVLVPVVVVLMLWTMQADRIRTAITWLAVFGAVCAFILLLFVGPEHFAQLIDVHVQARADPSSLGVPVLSLATHLANIPWLVLLAGVGGIAVMRRGDPLGLMMLGWSLVGAASLAAHAPVWPHQSLLVTLPAAVVGGIGVGDMIARVARRFGGSKTRWHGLVAIGLMAVACATPRKAVNLSDPAINDLSNELLRNGQGDRLVITDRPMFVYRAGLTTSPWLGAMTLKRLATGALTEEDVIKSIRSDRPHQVLLARFECAGVRDAMAGSYEVVISNHVGTLYRRRADGAKPDTVDATWQSWTTVLSRPDSWFHSAEAQGMADWIVQTQGPHGGWSKHLVPGSRRAGDAATATAPGEETIDNGATISQMRFLSRMPRWGADTRYLDAIKRGLEFLLLSQYACGGWPQIHPPPPTYEGYATLNDEAHVSAAALLGELQESDFVDEATRDRCRLAVERAVDFLLRSQVRIDGQSTVWCQQYDPVSLEPKPARSFEPAALASRESVGALRFLMARENPTPEMRKTIHAAAAWFVKARLAGLRIEERPDASLPHGRDRIEVEDPDAPPIWARFYTLDAQRPVFMGRDGIPKSRLNDIEAERRAGYDYYTREPAELLDTDYPAWCRRNQEPLPHVETSGN